MISQTRTLRVRYGLVMRFKNVFAISTVAGCKRVFLGFRFAALRVIPHIYSTSTF
jgi:hypothetical protein